MFKVSLLPSMGKRREPRYNTAHLTSEQILQLFEGEVKGTGKLIPVRGGDSTSQTIPVKVISKPKKKEEK